MEKVLTSTSDPAAGKAGCEINPELMLAHTRNPRDNRILRIRNLLFLLCLETKSNKVRFQKSSSWVFLSSGGAQCAGLPLSSVLWLCSSYCYLTWELRTRRTLPRR